MLQNANEAETRICFNILYVNINIDLVLLLQPDMEREWKNFIMCNIINNIAHGGGTKSLWCVALNFPFVFV